MPLMPEGNLQAYIKREPVQDELTFLDYEKQLLKAVAVLVEHQLLHRDIKLDNVLVRKGDAGRNSATLILTDFGTLRSFDAQRTGCTAGNPVKSEWVGSSCSLQLRTYLQ
jgi:serine/threonine protein kinase